MLTQSYINKISRLMDQVGELRPGFLHDGATPLEGSAEPCSSTGRNRRAKRNANGKTVQVNVVFETDKSTGEIRTVLKQPSR